MKDKANKGYWQRLAKIYAPLMESDKKFYNAICGYIRDYLKSDMNVLELACGTGQLSFPLSDCTNSWTAKERCRALPDLWQGDILFFGVSNRGRHHL